MGSGQAGMRIGASGGTNKNIVDDNLKHRSNF